MHHLSGTQHETSVCLVLQRPLVPKKTLLDNFKRAILEAKHLNEFRPDDVLWEKISKGLLRNPDRFLKNTDKRMVYIYNNMFFVKKDFAFGFRTVKSGEIHWIQTTHVLMQIYELPSSSLGCRANPNLFQRSFEPYDQMLYHRMELEPHTAYPIPARTHYILLTMQKTVFGLDIIPEMILPQLMENGFNLGDFRQRKHFVQKAYKLPPPTPSCYRTIIRQSVAPVRIIKPSTALATPQPVSIPEPPERTTPQILLSDPPPKRTTPHILLSDPPVPTTTQILLSDPPPERTAPQILFQIHHLSGRHLKSFFQIHLCLRPLRSFFQIHLSRQHLRSFYQIHLWSRLWSQPFWMTIPWIKSCRQNLETICNKGFPWRIPKNLRCWTRCFPCLTRFGDKSWTKRFSVQHLLDHCRQRTTIVFENLGRWPDRVTYYEPDYPYIILFGPNFGVHIPRSFGKTVIVFTSHLDLTWDKGVELRFFQVDRPHSHRVWGAYSLDLTDCLRVADVYVKWLTRLDDWEMHRYDLVPWQIVGLQPWKRALEQHVQRSHEKALAHGMPSDVTLLDHI
ncbi:uncharacterized protein TNCV_4761201 [Trichonephila clavipes]|uniref:Uncharacterized protein n=1 Tax=Trichonephila clavipes TaxID=2585209 RepID=A0A8X6UUL1_TRICX|nr:uncharacterized protein TNCV_4761201 [Trichonephila clavipes]